MKRFIRCVHKAPDMAMEAVMVPLASSVPYEPDCDTCVHFKPADVTKPRDYDKCLRYYRLHRDVEITVFENANYAYRNLCHGIHYREKKN